MARGLLSHAICVPCLALGAAVITFDAAKAQFNLPGVLDRAARSLNKGIPVPHGPSRSGSSSDNNRSSRHNGRREGSNEESGGQPAARQNAADSRNFARAEAERQQIEAANRMESDRNVESAVGSFIEDLRRRHTALLGRNRNVKVATGLDINQVTAGQVRAAVEDAYKQAHLYDFEKLAGEMWTRDRLMVLILRHARKSLGPYFDGAGAKGPSMGDITDVFGKSAKNVYAKALETGEIIGVSHSFDRFIRTIYEQSDRAPESLWTTGADGRYERLMSTVIDTVPRQVFAQQSSLQVNDPLGLERQFQFRFRARRALYDCLAANYGQLTSTGTIAANVRTGSVDKDPPSRGARIEGMQPGPAKENPAPGATVVSVLDSGGVWSRTEGTVKHVCKDRIATVLKSATDGDLQPQSARLDMNNYGSGPAGGREIAPARTGPRQ